MSNPTNTLILHACGGAGINLSSSVGSIVEKLGDGFCNVEFRYLDTSRANYDKIEAKCDLFQITSKDVTKNDIKGSGGERQTHANDIVDSVKEYLSKNKIKEPKIDEYHVVMFSASGGSGNIIGSVLVQELLKKSIPTVAYVIGDSSNGLCAINTLNVLSTLNNIALKTNKPLVVSYVNNHQLFNGNMIDAEKAADKMILNSMSTLSLFLSGRHEGLDNQDLINIIDQSNYKTISLPAGLYGLHFYSKAVELPEGASPTVGRTLATSGQDFDTKVNLLHHKKGFIDSENAVKIMGDQLPIHMLVYANFFAVEEKILKPITEDYYATMDKVKNQNVSGTSRSSMDDDTGFIF